MLSMRVVVESAGEVFDVRGLREEVVSSVVGRVLGRIVELQPVETGRTREAWMGMAFGVGGDDGDVRVNSDEHVTQVDLVNRVEYLPFVEYGTSKMEPVGMVRRALGEGGAGR